MFARALLGFGILFLLFVPLERLFALRPQAIFRRGWTTDAIYYAIGNSIGQAAAAGIPVLLALSVLNRAVNPDLQAWVAAQPIALQLPAVILTAELGYYGAHRLLHTVPWLWRFHAIHHSSEQLDWLTTVRVHPVDQVLTKTCQLVPIFLLGFSVETLGIYALFSSAIAFFIHANLRWRFGPLNWLLVTPEFHHWHHAREPQAHNKNLAAQCSLVDRLFGSFYLPRRRPQAYGIPDPVPSHYWPQFLYPFSPKIAHARR